MPDLRDLSRTLKIATVGLLIISAVSFTANAQLFGNSHSVASPNTPSTASPTESEARDELNKGVVAYYSARYGEAIAHFRRATELVPWSLLAKRDLAAALQQTIDPRREEYLETAQQAIDLYKQVLDSRPRDLDALRNIAEIEFIINRLDDARACEKRVLDADPHDSSADYTIGFLDWTQATQHALAAMKVAGVTDDHMGNARAPAEVMETIKAQNAALVDEALRYLNQAIALQPDSPQAMACMYMVYLRKADLDWDDEIDRKDDLVQAAAWLAKSEAKSKADEEKRLKEQASMRH
jgi:tetratricopeptide (TPR) repeat protein